MSGMGLLLGCDVKPAGGGEPTTLVYDQCSGSGDISGRTPDTTDTPGTTWVEDNFGFSAGSGVFNPTGDYKNNPNAIATIDCGQADVTITVDVNAGGRHSATDLDAVARYQDNNNFWIAVVSIDNSGGASGALSIYERTGGSFVQRATRSATVSNNVTYTITFTLSGSSLSANVNDGGSAITYTSSDFSANTKHGVRCADDNSSGLLSFDNFKVTNP